MVHQRLGHHRPPLPTMTTPAADPRLAALLRRARALLLDFDGPITPLMPPPRNSHVADALRAILATHHRDLPRRIRDTTDHLEVLRQAYTDHPDIADQVDAEAVRQEITAATDATPTPGAIELLTTCRDRKLPVAIVSNNSAEAVREFLSVHHLEQLPMHGRPVGRPDVMKPSPVLLIDATTTLDVKPQDCVMIGDSITDAQASRATGVPFIGYGKTPTRSAELVRAGADSVVEAVDDIVGAVSNRS
ncbi:MAG: HAD family hydrolase [Angustibacter sp.]